MLPMYSELCEIQTRISFTNYIKTCRSLYPPSMTRDNVIPEEISSDVGRCLEGALVGVLTFLFASLPPHHFHATETLLSLIGRVGKSP